MPSSNPLNPVCPVCNLPMHKAGKQKSGAQIYRCKRHTPNATITDSDRPAFCKGEKTGKALTPKEKRLLWKQRDPIGYAESQKRRNARRRAKIKETKQ